MIDNWYFGRICCLASRRGLRNHPVTRWVRQLITQAWIERLFGPLAAKEAQIRYNRCKSSVIRTWDRILYSLERSQGKLEAHS